MPTDQIGVGGGGERVEGEKRLFGAPRFPNPKSANEKPPKFFQNFVMRSHVSFELSITKIELRGTFTINLISNALEEWLVGEIVFHTPIFVIDIAANFSEFRRFRYWQHET